MLVLFESQTLAVLGFFRRLIDGFQFVDVDGRAPGSRGCIYIFLRRDGEPDSQSVPTKLFV